MKMSVYLHKEVADTLRCYGDLDEVVNKILEQCEGGIIDVFNKPKAPERYGAIRYNIDVTNEYYLSLLANYPPNSPFVSLRRLLYWFVEEEMYEVLEWKTCTDYGEKEREKCLKRVNEAKSILFSIKRYLTASKKEKIDEIFQKINELETML